MSLTPMQEEFMRSFLERQREIGKQALETTKLLSRTNIEGILWAGLDSPPTHDKLEEVLDELRAERERQAVADIEEKIDALMARKKELEDGNQV